MENIIKKAIKGGFGRSRWVVNGEEGQWVHENNYRNCVCDPLFWQALGKACGWKRLHRGCGGNMICPKYASGCCMEGWEREALNFHERNLTQSWNDAIAYLEDITKSN